VKRSNLIAFIGPSVITFAAIIAMLSIVVAAIANADWQPGLAVVLWAGVIGAIAGVALAHSSFPSFAAHITAAIYGMFAVVYIVGTQPSLAAVGGAGLAGWRERVFIIADKIVAFSRAALNNGSSRDGIIFMLILSALLWLLGYTAAWYSFRVRRIWHVLLPASVTLLSNVYYYSGDKSMTPYLVLFLLCALVLLVQSHFADREEHWRIHRVRFSQTLRTHFISAGVLIALVALVFSWRVTVTAASPSSIAALQQMNPSYSEFMARWNRMFSTLNNYNLREIDRYGQSHALGGPRNLSPEPVMRVSIAAVEARPSLRHYWRAQVLDHYDGTGWVNTARLQLDLGVNDVNVQQPVYLGRAELQANFALYRGTDSVWTPGQPVRVNLPTRGMLAPLGGEDVELQQLVLPVALLAGNRYSAFGSMSLVDVERLRVARQDYPIEIAAAYLQLPSTVPDRVKALAQAVASRTGASSAFDKALAVETFLRTAIEYDEKATAPPAGREASDYVLFETRRAYCDYYATAMIVMLRTLGVPARMAVGYAQGDLDAEASSNQQQTFVVKANDAHTWVEVYFPDYGWVEFEPTAQQPPLRRIDSSKPQQEQEKGVTLGQPPTATPKPQAQVTATPQPNQNQAPATPQPTPGGKDDGLGVGAQPSSVAQHALNLLIGFWQWARFLLIIPLIAGLGWLALNVAERAGLGKFPPIERVYAMLSRWAQWIGVGHNQHLTPYEQAQKLSQRAPAAEQQALQVTEIYVAYKFSSGSKSVKSQAVIEQSDTVVQIWPSLRRSLSKVWFSTLIPSPALALFRCMKKLLKG
jgi:transglutaminase-like putative cysteine protease